MYKILKANSPEALEELANEARKSAKLVGGVAIDEDRDTGRPTVYLQAIDTTQSAR